MSPLNVKKATHKEQILIKFKKQDSYIIQYSDIEVYLRIIYVSAYKGTKTESYYS